MSRETMTIAELANAKADLAEKMNELVDEFEDANEVPELELLSILDVEASNRSWEIQLGI